MCTKGRHVKTFNLFLRIGFGCNNIDRCVNWPDGVTGLYWYNMTQCEAGRAIDSVGNKMNILPYSTDWSLLPMFFREIKCFFFQKYPFEKWCFVSKGYVSIHVNCTLKLCREGVERAGNPPPPPKRVVAVPTQITDFFLISTFYDIQLFTPISTILPAWKTSFILSTFKFLEKVPQ